MPRLIISPCQWIERGVTHYNPQTGVWEWEPPSGPHRCGSRRTSPSCRNFWAVNRSPISLVHSWRLGGTHTHRESMAPGPIPQTERQGPFLWQGSAAPAAGSVGELDTWLLLKTVR
jgi:hypothetical protein